MLGIEIEDDSLSRYEAIFPARLTAVDAGPTFAYAWTEQVYNPVTNVYESATPARSGTLTRSPAYELNNTLLTIGTPFPLVWLRFRTVANGDEQYEFDAGGSFVAGNNAGNTYCPLAALQTTDCVTAGGITLTYSGGVWSSTALYTYPGGSGTFSLSYSAGALHLSLTVQIGAGAPTPKELMFCPSTGCWNGGPLTGHVAAASGSGAPPACAGQTFSVCVTCTPCITFIATVCCPSVLIPSTLYLAIAGDAGSINGVYPLTYSAGGWRYNGPMGTCTTGGEQLVLSCYDVINGWAFNSLYGGITSTFQNSQTCSPFSLVFGGNVSSSQYISNLQMFHCGSVFRYTSTWTVTATDPRSGSYSLTGPSSGALNAASTSFTVTPAATSTATVTPHSTGAGTFSPTSVTFSGVTPQTFTYTPTSSAGSPHTITTTNGGGLTDPGGIAYAVTSDCFAGSCGAGVSAMLTATFTGSTGCYTALPSSMTLSCANSGATHYWGGTSTFTACGATDVVVIRPAVVGGPPFFKLLGTNAAPDAGYACYPFAAVYHVNDGAGNTCVITVSG